jgi:hypothetical protein
MCTCSSHCLLVWSCVLLLLPLNTAAANSDPSQRLLLRNMTADDVNTVCDVHVLAFPRQGNGNCTILRTLSIADDRYAALFLDSMMSLTPVMRLVLL